MPTPNARWFWRFASCLVLLPSLALAAEKAPDQSGWWDDTWWETGRLEAPRNYAVTTRTISYPGREGEVSALVVRPADKRKYPAVLFQHGRRGLDELVQLQVKRLAARGFVVLAPDLYGTHFIAPFPIEHDYALEEDLDRGIAALLALPDVSTKKACLASHSRGGYMTLKVAVRPGRQDKTLACYVAWYPHLQDPNAPEPAQVYAFAPEIEQLTLPTLIFVGEDEQYQRKRNIEEAVKALRGTGRSVQLVIYPGVGRGFDFRPPNVRTFADDLASKDAVQRAATFMQRHLK